MAEFWGRLGLTVVAYVVTTFAVQGTSHFALNADYYAAIPIMRTEPVVALGLTSMLIQGAVFAWLFPIYYRGGSAVWAGVTLAWLVGGFLASYIALGEAGKYAIPSIPGWIATEAGAALVQFTIFGVLLGLINRPR